MLYLLMKSATSIVKQLNLNSRCTVSCQHIMDDIACFRVSILPQTEQVEHLEMKRKDYAFWH